MEQDGAVARRLRTFKGRETAIEDQFQIAKLALAQQDRGQSLGLGLELIMARSVSCEQILEDTAVGRVRHGFESSTTVNW